MRRQRSASGFTYISVLFAVALAGVALALTATVWRTTSQRAKEEQLLFAGGQFAQAIGSYHRQSPGPQRQYPKTFDDLLRDPRYPDTRRHLRRVFIDPMTGKADWVVVRAPDGGMLGVRSSSTDKAVRAVPALVNGTPVGGERYADWQFLYAGSSGGNP